MSAGSLSTVFSWVALACTLLTLLSSGLALHYRNISSQEKEAEVGGLKTELSEAGDKVKDLLRRQTARKLTDEQKATIGKFLEDLPAGSFSIKASVNASDARGFGDEIAEIFRKKSWQVGVDSAIFAGGDTSGVWLTVRNDRIPEIATVLASALVAASIEVRTTVNIDANGPEAGGVWLNIGSIK